MTESIVRIGAESIIIVFRRSRILQGLGTGTYRTLRGNDGQNAAKDLCVANRLGSHPHVRMTTSDPVASQNRISYP